MGNAHDAKMPPWSLLMQQRASLRALARIALSTVLPGRRPKHNPQTLAPVSLTLPALSPELVDQYCRWAGAAPGRYRDQLPPHMVCQWALPAAAGVLEQTRYPLSGVINQGCALTVHGPLPAGEPLIIEARAVGIEERDNRARVSIEIVTGTSATPGALRAVMHSVFVLGPREKRTVNAPPDRSWETIGAWRADGRDGLRFAILTGDLNPIHWMSLAGRLSPFRQKVLHGFGMWVRSYEIILAACGEITAIDVRFVRPVPLPSAMLQVCVGAAQEPGVRSLRLTGNDGLVHMVGDFRIAGSATD